MVSFRNIVQYLPRGVQVTAFYGKVEKKLRGIAGALFRKIVQYLPLRLQIVAFLFCRGLNIV